MIVNNLALTTIKINSQNTKCLLRIQKVDVVKSNNKSSLVAKKNKFKNILQIID